MLFEIFSLILGFILIVYFYFQYNYQFFKRLNIYFLDPSFPFGNWGKVVTQQIWMGHEIEKFYQKANDKNAPAIGIYNVTEPTLILCDPELIKQCLIKDFQKFHDRGLIRPAEKLDPLSGHLFALNGKKWRNLRIKLSPTFTSGKIKMMFPIIKDRSNDLVKYLEENKDTEFEVRDLFARLLTDIIASCAFGISCNSIENPNDEFRHMGKNISVSGKLGTFKRTLDMFCRPLRLLLKLKLSNPESESYFINMVRDTIKYREENNIKRNDFMQLLIQLKNNENIDDEETKDLKKSNERDGTSLTILECAAQAFVFFVAGFETSSTTMSFAIYELVTNPETQLRVQEEIDEVMRRSPTLTYESLAEMEYLEQVINETLRKYPPLPMLNRITTERVEMKCGINKEPVLIEKGIKMLIPVQGLHYDPKYFPNPEKFDPDRFSAEKKVHIPTGVYLPFGDGQRNCIGARFGLIQTKVGLACLLHKFNFKTCSKTPIPMKIAVGFVPKSEKGIYINIEKRK